MRGTKIISLIFLRNFRVCEIGQKVTKFANSCKILRSSSSSNSIHSLSPCPCPLPPPPPPLWSPPQCQRHILGQPSCACPIGGPAPPPPPTPPPAPTPAASHWSWSRGLLPGARAPAPAPAPALARGWLASCGVHEAVHGGNFLQGCRHHRWYTGHPGPPHWPGRRRGRPGSLGSTHLGLPFLHPACKGRLQPCAQLCGLGIARFALPLGVAHVKKGSLALRGLWPHFGAEI